MKYWAIVPLSILYNGSCGYLVASAFAIWYTLCMWTKYTVSAPISQEEYQKVYVLLSAAIPPEKRREYSIQRALLQHSAYTLYSYGAGNAVEAMLAAWEFSHLRYVEHFAVKEALRNQGLGTRLLQAYMQQSDLPVILESEEPGASAMAERRLAFFSRCGFHTNTEAYSQPPRSKGMPWVSAQLLSWPAPLNEADFSDCRVLLYREVYGLSSHSLAKYNK